MQSDLTHHSLRAILNAAMFAGLVLLLPLWGTVGVAPAAAQPTEGAGVTVGVGEALQVGGLIQADGLFGREGATDGFRARSARLRLGGRAEGVSYVVQTDFTSPGVLLDAFVQLPLASRLRLRGGLFKTPYSAEFLRPRPRIRFAERARVVNALAPNRQAGVQLAGDLTGEGTDAQVTATVGAFNGTRVLSANDNDNFLYLGRLTGSIPLSSGGVDLGVSAGYSIDDRVAIPNTDPSFSGDRFLFQADAQFETGRWVIAGELHTANLDRDGVTIPELATRSPFGYYVTAGIDVAEGHQVLARVDSYDPDDVEAAPDEQIVLGYNYDPSSVLRVLVNYQAPSGDLSDGFVTGRLQVAF